MYMHHLEISDVHVGLLFANWGERDFPGDLMVKDLPSNAGGPGSILGWGTNDPTCQGQLSLCATAREPTCCK